MTPRPMMTGAVMSVSMIPMSMPRLVAVLMIVIAAAAAGVRVCFVPTPSVFRATGVLPPTIKCRMHVFLSSRRGY